MSAATLTIFAKIETYTCCYHGCGIILGLEQGFARLRREDHKGWYCPNGHLQFFPADSEADRMRKELEQEKKRRTWAEESRDRERKSAARNQRRANAFKGIVTKTKKRVGNGVCPCCNRTFENLLSHMKTKHPSYKEAKL